jgi:hypothetical protein
VRNYLLIESRAGFGRPGGGWCVELALALAAAGDSATVLLVQNGVLSARASASADGIAELAVAGIPVLADRFSLAERGIGADALAPAIRPVPLDVVIDRMLDGWKVLWH